VAGITNEQELWLDVHAQNVVSHSHTHLGVS
jgi:hypothetical protein